MAPLVGLVALLAAAAAVGQPATQNQTGAPQQVVPTYQETGIPSFAAASGSATGQAAGGSAGIAPIGGSTATGDQTLNTLLSQSFGQAAVTDAAALGVSADALAATCVLESNCQNVGGTGTISGAFQMSNSTYNEAIAAALADDPDLASVIVRGLAGKSDPATEAIAAAEYIAQNAEALQNAGIDDPTVLQVRGGYNFGPQNGVALAQAPDDAVFADVVNGLSAATLAANGIQPGETVGQWRQSVGAKIGSVANSPALIG